MSAAISSMTGFARIEGGRGDWSWVAEARSVNGRNLEVRFRGPSGWDSLERIAREAAQKRFERGQIGLTLALKRSERAAGSVIDEARLAMFVEAARRLAAAGAAPPSADGLLALPGVLRAEAPDLDAAERSAMEAALAGALEAAVAALADARRSEGEALARLLGERLDEIERLMSQARAAAAEQPRLMYERFAARLRELAGESASEERIVQEAAAMAVRVDVQEEMDRLGAHIAAARALLAQGGAAGRRLDFLAQEFMREANTLTSKSAAPGLTAVGLELKANVDKLREQAANVE